ncbi:uncharacterized protein LOC123664742 [Melitaea cinxia]|uniref:uncharacterized protein LOC123664742 n=1 Tax=Melitaea cinxia TaxID=113334 RepID=UPI001E27359F|nr:uncharacterized protein LOC123664742 [Melitaea cinxia]
MNTKLVLLFAFASVVSSNDLTIGSDTEGRKIFDEIRQANPAIWRQIENVTIIAPSDEVISRVVVTDMRPEKDGDVQIVAGGERKNNVTIELKSPTVLRGYEFHLEVYSVPETKLTDAEENISEPTLTTDQSSVPENSEASQDTDGSGDNIETSEMPDYVEKTTETAESSTNNGIPSLVGRVDGDILRPARETYDDNNNPKTPVSEGSSNLHPSVVAGDSDVTTTENVKIGMDLSDEATSESEMAPKIYENEKVTDAPESFDNSKNIPDYPALSILDYIKSKEGARSIRYTQVETSETSQDGTTTESNIQSTQSVDMSYTSLPAAEPSGSRNEDDTVDLVPPVETDYNTDFSSNDENTEKPIENSTTLNRPRAGRGLDTDNIQEQAFATEIPIEITTTDNENSESSTTKVPIDDQLRNTRDARKDLEDNESNDLNSSLYPTQTETPLCNILNNGDKQANALNPNVLILNGDQLTLTPDNYKLQFGIPIVLIIGSNTNIPTIKIIAESVSDENKVDIQPLQGSVEENLPEEKSNDYPQDKEIQEDDFVPNPVTNDNFVPNPVMNYN